MIISVFGKSGSGKSTVAINLSKKIAENKQTVGIISTELRYSDIAKLFSIEIEEKKSLINAILDHSNVLDYYTQISTDIYLLSVATDTNIKNLDIVSDYIKSASTVEEEKIQNIRSMIKNSDDIFDVLIIDCTDKVDDTLTFLSLISSDKILNVIESSLSGLSFEVAHKPLKTSERFKDKWKNILNKHIESIMNKHTIENAIGEKIDHEIIFSKDIFISGITLESNKELSDKTKKLYNDVFDIKIEDKGKWSFFKKKTYSIDI